MIPLLERLQKILSSAGVASRRRAEELIEQGRVTVNGQVAQLGQSADAEADTIAVDGRRIALGGERIYIMLNKPRGFVTTLSDERGRKTVAELVSGVGTRLYPVGRLDMDSEGLLILTNDGEVANRLMHPRHGVMKVYRTRVMGEDIDAAVYALREMKTLDGEPIEKPKVQFISMDGDRALLDIMIGEGKNRQVRRMCDAVGLRVLRLKRIAEGELLLGRLPTGKWRRLSQREIEYLCHLS